MDEELLKHPTRFQKNIASVIVAAIAASVLAAAARGACVAYERGFDLVDASAGDMVCFVVFGMVAFVAGMACIAAIAGLFHWLDWATSIPVAEKPAAEFGEEEEDWR